MRIRTRMASLCCVAVFCLLGAGCLAADPFGEIVATPATPSTPYAGPAPRSPVEETRSVLPPELAQEPLSLAECVYIAVRNNPRTRVSWRHIREAAAGVGSARSSYLPQIEFSADSQRQKSQVLTEVEAEFLRDVHGARFQLQHVLLDGGTRSGRLRAAQAALLRFDFHHNRVLLDVALEAEQRYYELLSAQSLLEVARDTVKQRQRHLEVAQQLYEVGKRRRMDVAQVRAELADARLSETQARHQLRLARGQLASALGLSASEHLEVQEPPQATQAAVLRQVDELMLEAARGRPQLRSAAAQISGIRQQLRAERARRWPTLSLNASYGWAGTHLVSEERDEWSLGLNLQLPIFTGFSLSYNVRQLEEQTERALAEYEQLLRGVELEVWQAYSAMIQAEESITRAEVFVESALESVEATERSYEQGMATVVELIDAQTALTRARVRRIRAQLQLRTAIAQLERALGRSWRDEAAGAAPPDHPHPPAGPRELP